MNKRLADFITLESHYQAGHFFWNRQTLICREKVLNLDSVPQKLSIRLSKFPINFRTNNTPKHSHNPDFVLCIRKKINSHPIFYAFFPSTNTEKKQESMDVCGAVIKYHKFMSYDVILLYFYMFMFEYILCFFVCATRLQRFESRNRTFLFAFD